VSPRPDDQFRFRRGVEEDVRRMQKAVKERGTLLAQTVYLGTVGLLFILPVVGCAYLGLWLDGLAEPYASRWTPSLIVLGVVVGAVNVYYFIREKG
jgi:ATP synthase protein I